MTKRILLADDDADDRLLFEDVFTDLPEDQYRLTTAENGEEVINFLEDAVDDQLPHLIILDQNMPLRSGKETLLYLKSASRYRDIPVIIYSTYNDKNFVQECQALGATAVVSKPDSYEGYVQMINTFLRYATPTDQTRSEDTAARIRRAD